MKWPVGTKFSTHFSRDPRTLVTGHITSINKDETYTIWWEYNEMARISYGVRSHKDTHTEEELQEQLDEIDEWNILKPDLLDEELFTL